MSGACPNSTNGSVFERYSNDGLRKEFFPIGSYVQRYWDPVVIAFGIIGNVISFRVWITAKLRRENSSAVYLAAISLTDFILLLFMIPDYLMRTRGIQLINKEVICQAFNMFFIIFQYYSIPLVFAFTLERYIAICYPFQRERFCTTRKACIAVGIIGAFLMGLGIVQLFAWVYIPDKQVCVFRDSFIGNQYIAVYFILVEIFMSALLPICTLLFNILVLKELRRITRAASKHAPLANAPANNTLQPPKYDEIPLASDDVRGGGGPPKERSRESSSFRSTTMMLLTVSFYLIVSTLPVGITYLCQFAISEGPHCLTDDEVRADPVWRRFITGQTIKECVDRFTLSHYACNFIIYLATGKAFRKQAIKLLFCGRLFGDSNEDEYYRTARESSFATNGKSRGNSRAHKVA